MEGERLKARGRRFFAAEKGEKELNAERVEGLGFMVFGEERSCGLRVMGYWC